jgi:hypothetical protein
MAYAPKIIAALIWVASCTNSQSGPSQTQTTSPSIEKANAVSEIEHRCLNMATDYAVSLDGHNDFAD